MKGSDFVNVVLDGNQLYATTKGEIFCLDTATGQPRWHNKLTGMGTGLIVIATPTGSQVLSAQENVALPLQIRGMAAAEAEQKAAAALAEVGLAEHAQRRPDLLSGGQRQRVAIARALVTQPEIVIADEPTANLDAENSRLVIELMRDMNQRHKVTFLFSTHDPRLIDKVGRLIKLADGQLVNGEQA